MPPIPAPFTKKSLLAKSLLASLLATAGYAQAGSPYSSVTFFGDSLTDGGYFSPITQRIPNMSQSGQFTTNPDNTWATSFANQLGLTSVANQYGSPTTGNNYAIGGARAGVTVTNSNFGFDIPIASASSQIDTYLANNRVDANGLYVVWAGANDLLAAFNDPSTARSTIGAAVNSQVMNIKTLSDAGAKYILVPTIPDIGLTPNVVGTPLQQIVTYATTQFNEGMLNGASQLNANIIPLDTFSLLQQITKSPSTYGFTNVTDKACLTDSSLLCGRNTLVAPNANETYLFADSVHPTGQVHQMIADYANAVVTAPGQIGALPQLIAGTTNTTNQQVMTHLDQRHHIADPMSTSQQSLPARNLWVTGSVQGQDYHHLESSGDTQLLVGMDVHHPKSPHAVSGIYGSISKQQFNQNQLSSGLSKVGVDQTGIGFYHANTLDKLGGLQINGNLGYNKLDVDVTRQVTLQTHATQFNTNAKGKQYYANLQAGYPMQVSNTAITPYLGASINRVRLGEFKEDEVSGIAMTFDKQNHTSSYGKVGVKANKALNDTMAVFGDVYYQTRLSDKTQAVTANLNSLPNQKFTTPQTKFDEDNLGITVGLTRQFGEYNANVGVMYENGKNTDTSRVFLGLNKAF